MRAEAETNFDKMLEELQQWLGPQWDYVVEAMMTGKPMDLLEAMPKKLPSHTRTLRHISLLYSTNMLAEGNS